MDISQALRLINQPNLPSTSSVYEGSPSSERNLDLLYLSGGVPIVRIETWLAYDRAEAPFNHSLISNTSSSSLSDVESQKATMCRDLAMVTCVYGNHLTVGLTANCEMDGKPGLDLILNTMFKQVRSILKLSSVCSLNVIKQREFSPVFFVAEPPPQTTGQSISRQTGDICPQTAN